MHVKYRFEDRKRRIQEHIKYMRWVSFFENSVTNGSKYSKMDQVNLAEGSF